MKESQEHLEHLNIQGLSSKGDFYWSFKFRGGFLNVLQGVCCERWYTDHGCLFYNRVVGLLQIAVENVAKHTGGILMQVPSSLGHTVVFTPDGNVDALFLRKNNGNNSRECLSKNQLFFINLN